MDTREDVAQRVREALERHTALVEPDPDSLARLRERIARERTRRRGTARWVLAASAVAAGVAVLLVLTLVLPLGGGRAPSPPAGTLATTGPDAEQPRPPQVFAASRGVGLVVVDTQSGQILAELPNSEPVITPTLTADGLTVFGIVEDAKLVRIDVASGRVDTIAEAGALTGYFATPDGRRLGYVRQAGADGPAEVVLTDNQRVLTSTTLRAARAPALSPDGAALVFVGDDPTDLSLRVVDLAGAGSLDDARALAHPPGCVHQLPVWVDGGLFAVQVCGQSGTTIKNSLVRLDPSADTSAVVAELPRSVSTLSGWSDGSGTRFLLGTPDGIYLTDLAGPAELRRVPAQVPLDDAHF